MGKFSHGKTEVLKSRTLITNYQLLPEREDTLNVAHIVASVLVDLKCFVLLQLIYRPCRQLLRHPLPQQALQKLICRPCRQLPRHPLPKQRTPSLRKRRERRSVRRGKGRRRKRRNLSN